MIYQKKNNYSSHKTSTPFKASNNYLYRLKSKKITTSRYFA